MIGVDVPRVFPRWRTSWNSIDGVPDLLDRADAIFALRIKGVATTPRSGYDTWSETEIVAIRALQAWVDGKPPAARHERAPIARRMREVLNEALQRSVWPRWLLLENALLDASESGDLGFAAAVLRTMCEEAMRLGALDLDADRVEEVARSDEPDDQARLTAFLEAAWCMFAPLSRETVLGGKGWPKNQFAENSMPRLAAAKARLNAYVHPNYGAHIATLHPEAAQSARLLLEALEAAYEAFFALTWSSAVPPVGSAARLGLDPPSVWAETLRRLSTQVLPSVRRKTGNIAATQILEAPSIMAWLKRMEAPSGQGQVDTDRADDPAEHGPGTLPLPWDGAGAGDARNLEAARSTEASLAAEFPAGAPAIEDQHRWLRFNELSLQLAVTLDRAKAEALKVQLARQIVRGNSLGIWLVIRSAIEQRAQAAGLPTAIRAHLDKTAPLARAGEPLPSGLSAIDQAVTNVLAAESARTVEGRRPWVGNEDGSQRRAWSRPTNVVAAGLAEDDRFRTLFELGSAVMHGRSQRGINLLDEEEALTNQARVVGLLVLERLCDFDGEMAHLSSAAVELSRIRHAASLGGTTAVADDPAARHVLGLDSEPLRAGADFEGTGTREDPFRFVRHVEFYRASRALLAQLGVDLAAAERTLGGVEGGMIRDVWKAGERTYWFEHAI